MSTAESREWDAHNDRIADDQAKRDGLDEDGFLLDEDGCSWGHCNSCGGEARAGDECCDDGEVTPDYEPDGAPCCMDPDCNGSPCTWPGYADNH